MCHDAPKKSHLDIIYVKVSFIKNNLNLSLLYKLFFYVNYMKVEINGRYLGLCLRMEFKMSKKKKDLIKFEIGGHIIECEEKETSKYEVANELGLLDKVVESGWKNLSAKEAGKIGGVMRSKTKNIGNPS